MNGKCKTKNTLNKSTQNPYNLFTLAMVCFLIFSCSRKISPLNSYNLYLDDFNNYVINDSLKFIHKTYGNIEFPKTKKKLSSLLNESFPEANGVLIGAQSLDSTNIKYAILINPKKKELLTKNSYFTRDTIIGESHYLFISNNKWALQGWELKNAFIDAFYIGDSYREKIPGIFDFQNSCSQSSTFLRCLKGYLDFPNYDKPTNDIKLQLALTYSSFLGQNYIYNELLRKYNSKEDLSKEIEGLKKIGIEGWTNAQKKILDLSNDNQVLMFSENHFKPQHRKTITYLLPKLKEQGFKYLALEALSPEADSLLNTGARVLNSTGFYTREQNYVELLETAQNEGFILISYDDFTSNRELKQAQNIFDKTLKMDPNSKIVVLAGFGHINESIDSKGNYLMAGHFKKISGIDPLTISQTTFSKHSFDKLYTSLLVECKDLPYEDKKKTDFALIQSKNFGIESTQNANFKYHNEHDFDTQLDIYRLEDLEHKYSHVKMPPLRSILVPKGEKVGLHLATGKTYKYFVSNKKAIMVDEGDIKL